MPTLPEQAIIKFNEMLTNPIDFFTSRSALVILFNKVTTQMGHSGDTIWQNEVYNVFDLNTKHNLTRNQADIVNSSAPLKGKELLAKFIDEIC